ncbi:MAG: DUF3307 domain-containing protein [Caldilineaceae bacterium]
MHLLITLLLGHLLADFPLQTNGLAKLKKKSLGGVFLHVLIYMTITALLLRAPFTYWPLIVGLGAVHFTIDTLKMYCNLKNEVLCFVIDQILHFITVALAVVLAYRTWNEVPVGILSNHVLIGTFLCAFVMALMVFCWVWANSLNEEQLKRHYLLPWIKQQMLVLEQRMGLALIGLIFAPAILRMFGTMVQIVLKY